MSKKIVTERDMGMVLSCMENLVISINELANSMKLGFSYIKDKNELLELKLERMKTDFAVTNNKIATLFYNNLDDEEN